MDVGALLGGLGSSLISGVGSLATSIVGNNWQESFWNKQNQYNKPINQKHRMMEAGLNPALMYSSGGVQNVAADAPDFVKPDAIANGSIGNQVNDTIRNAFQSDLADANKRLAEETIKNQQHKRDLMDAQTEAHKNQAELLKSQKLSEDERLQLHKLELAFQRASYDLRLETAKAALTELNKSIALIEGKIHQLEISNDANDKYYAALLKAQLDNYRAQTNHHRALTGLVDEQTTTVALENFEKTVSAEVLQNMQRKSYPTVSLDKDNHVVINNQKRASYQEFMSSMATIAQIKGAEHARRYLSKEFDGSTTEKALAWLNGITGTLRAGAPFLLMP